MDKISIQITINSITSPELLQYLKSIQSPKHRAELLRRLAETGLGAMGASGSFAASQQPIAQAAPAVPVPPSHEGADRPALRSEQRPGPRPDFRPEPPARQPVALAHEQAASPGSDALTPSSVTVVAGAPAGAAPPPFALDMNSAMDRFF
ncbi:hypothetical protein [Cupriavidus sp. BIC8F]|uniref:hypothetical protein n=1 Tax=Cupriavidus sp. BIC8F TaxID=3079014 RepID=UPI002916D83F|nr:hypothetical protein [Cupriavidus sp. BIC8F]